MSTHVTTPPLMTIPGEAGPFLTLSCSDRVFLGSVYREYFFVRSDIF